MLRRLKVKNYKSLRNLDLRLGRLNVLVGPNAAGKSNILDCLAFLSELATWRGTRSGSEPEGPFEERGEFGDIVWGGDKQQSVSFELQGTFGLHGSAVSAKYSVGINAGYADTAEIREELALTAGSDEPIFTRDPNQVYYNGSNRSVGRQQAALSSPQPNNPSAQALQRGIAGWSVYDFQRSQIARRGEVRKETNLASDGSNAVTVLHWVRNEDVATFDRLESLLRQAIPEVEHLLTPPDEQGYVYIAFKEQHIPGRIPAWNLSEGSTRLVATLLALFVPQPPSLVAIESPEAALHPHLMEYLAEILRLGSQETQIVITTHSPYLLDKLPPESLIIVTKEKGETKARRPKKGKALKPESTEGRPWGQSLKKPSGAPLNLG